MTEYVLDSSAVLAVMFGEPGGEAAGAAIEGSFLSAANLSEIVSKLIERGVAPAAAREAAERLRCEVVAVDHERAMAVGLMHGETRGHGVSLGDRCCLALALEMALPVLTADRNWGRLDLGVEIQLIR